MSSLDSGLPRRTERFSVIKGGAVETTDTVEPKLFLNRELSWLAFNDRVLEEAKDASLPLYERLRFLGIVNANLDEFFMIRVAGLKQQIMGRVVETPADGMLALDQLRAVEARVHAMVEEEDRLFAEELLPALAAQGVGLLRPDQLAPEQRTAARAYFAQHVFPALTPLAVDPGHPFPQLRNKSMNVAVILWKRQPQRRARQPRESLLAVVQVPSVLRRLVPLPAGAGGSRAFALIGDLIEAHVGDLFPGYEVKQTAGFRVTRNSDLLVDEEESEDLLSTIQQELRRRELGAAVRLEIAADGSKELEALLARALKLEASDVYRVRSPFQIGDLMALADEDKRPELRYEPHTPVTPLVLRDGSSVVEVVAKRDLLLHHPYESFEPVVRFVEEAAEDPDVLAIKMTLYRTSGDSPFVRALERAAERGKQVTALVEIKARFDEANNIAWARRLEQNGVHVVYGVLGLKTHCKVALVVRREGSGIKRYVHIGTGNYNPQTARQYTDLSLFTAREAVAEDAAALFNMLTGYADAPTWKRLAVAPFDLQQRVVALIEREAERARAGQPARIIAKMNALVDPVAIRALYAASQAGVEIDLLVRGICCLRPGLAGVSDRVRVTSVVDRFLEHSRVFAFGAESPELFIASADWMPRNFHRRIEVMCPVEDPALKARLLQEVLGVAMKDTIKARRLQVDGSYARPEPGAAPGPGHDRLRSQQLFIERAREEREEVVRALVPAPTPAPGGAAGPSPPERTGDGRPDRRADDRR